MVANSDQRKWHHTVLSGALTWLSVYKKPALPESFAIRASIPVLFTVSSQFGLFLLEQLVQFRGEHNVSLHLQFPLHEQLLRVSFAGSDAQQVVVLDGDCAVGFAPLGRSGVHSARSIPEVHRPLCGRLARLSDVPEEHALHLGDQVGSLGNALAELFKQGFALQSGPRWLGDELIHVLRPHILDRFRKHKSVTDGSKRQSVVEVGGHYSCRERRAATKPQFPKVHRPHPGTSHCDLTMFPKAA